MPTTIAVDAFSLREPGPPFSLENADRL